MPTLLSALMIKAVFTPEGGSALTGFRTSVKESLPTSGEF